MPAFAGAIQLRSKFYLLFPLWSTSIRFIKNRQLIAPDEIGLP